MLNKFASQYPPLYYSLLALLSGSLLGLSFLGAPYLLFFAFLPLLEIDIRLKKQANKRLFWTFALYTYTALLIWNLIATYWIAQATLGGAIAAISLNALLMLIPWLLARYTRQNINEHYGYLSLILYWLSLEYLHLHWGLAWPWLTLGNAFAFFPDWVQWYEYTGVLGGSMWVLLVNIFLFLALKSYYPINRRAFAIYTVFFLLLGFLSSMWVKSTYQTPQKSVEVVVVQPNIDPYKEKFSKGSNFIPYLQQTERMRQLAASKISPNTRLVVLPEAAIHSGSGAFEVQNLENNPKLYNSLEKLITWQKSQKDLAILLGLSSFEMLAQGRIGTHYEARSQRYYNLYNSAFYLDSLGEQKALYHKSRLVPGVEYVPFSGIFKQPLLYFGGAKGVISPDSSQTCFIDNNLRIAPLICYESIFGDFLRNYPASNLLVIITNDAWWGNTAGHWQHFHYARLRAIEFRRSVARSANTGISGFINPLGKVLQQSDYASIASLKQSLPIEEKITFYATYGDYLGRLAWFMAVALFLSGVVKRRVG